MSGREGKKRSGLALLGAAVLLAASGCAAEPESAEGGMGLPVLAWVENPPIGETVIDGTLRVADNGCFLLDAEEGSYFVVWPDGFEHAGPVVATDDGSELGDGDPVRGVGEVLGADAAIELGGGKDSQLAAAIGYCVEDGEAIAFLARTTAR